MIYLDYMSTTPVDPRVVDVMMPCLGLQDYFGNPASMTHAFGIAAREIIDQSREQVAALINASPGEIIWTSGATESNNLAIKGASAFYQRRGRHIITLQTEHQSVLDVCDFLRSKQYDITVLKTQANGLIDLQELSDTIRLDTLLVSVMTVNNETGVIQDLAKIAELVKSRGVLLHTDATQAVGKIPVDVKKIPADLISLSAHKVYGPKGVGALYVRNKPKIHLEPLIHGGESIQAMRAGTLPTHQIAGMGKAYELARDEMHRDAFHVQQLSQQLLKALSSLTYAQNGLAAPRVPHCLNLCFPGIRSEALMLATPELAYSSGSACNSATLQPSHVLLAMGLSEASADCSVRLSLGRFTTSSDVLMASDILLKAVSRLSAIAGGFA